MPEAADASPARGRLRVAFAGTPEFARTALEAIVAAGFTVPLVLTQPDRPAGRGMKLQASPVKVFAQSAGIPVVQPRSLRLDGRHPEDAAAAGEALREAAPDVMVVAAYGLILPEWVLTLPPHGCLNIHASVLPRWRGAAPIHRAVEAGDAESGVTIMQMDAGLDTGPMLRVERVALDAATTTGRLHDTLAALGGRLIVEALDGLGRGGPSPQPQPAEGVTYARKIDKAEAQVDWREPAAVIERRIRAFDPFPGAVTGCEGESLKLWRAQVEPAPAPSGHAAPGTVLACDERGLLVACGDGALRVIEVQRPGGRRLPAAAVFAGRPVPPGTRLGAAAA